MKIQGNVKRQKSVLKGPRKKLFCLGMLNGVKVSEFVQEKKFLTIGE